MRILMLSVSFAGMILAGQALAKDDVQKMAGAAAAAAPARASGKFTECAAIRMREIALKHLETNNPEYFTQIPAGWTVVSGAGGEGYPKVLLCR